MSNGNPGGRDGVADDEIKEIQKVQSVGPAAPSGRAATFSFDGQTVRTVAVGHQTWFVAADVCAVLQHSDPTKAVARLDDEKGPNTVRTPGGDQEMVTVGESGLYALVLTSRKPQARAFRRWVTGEVLPALRATGRYDAHGRADGERPPSRRRPRIELPGRFVVLADPDGCDVRETGYDAMGQEATNVDVRVMCHQLGVIEGFWHKVKALQSLGIGGQGGFALGELEKAILKGGQLSQHYLRCYAELELLRRAQGRHPADGER